MGDVFHSALPVKLRQGAENKLRVHKTWQLTKAGEQFDITTIKSNAHKQKVIMQALQASQKLPPGATTVLKSLQQKALASMSEQLNHEWQRLSALKTINPSVRQAELDFIEFQQKELASYISKSQLKFEAIRMVVVSN